MEDHLVAARAFRPQIVRDVLALDQARIFGRTKFVSQLISRALRRQFADELQNVPDHARLGTAVIVQSRHDALDDGGADNRRVCGASDGSRPSPVS